MIFMFSTFLKDMLNQSHVFPKQQKHLYCPKQIYSCFIQYQVQMGNLCPCNEKDIIRSEQEIVPKSKLPTQSQGENERINKLLKEFERLKRRIADGEKEIARLNNANREIGGITEGMKRENNQLRGDLEVMNNQIRICRAELEKEIRQRKLVQNQKETLKVEMGKLRSLGGDRPRRDLESVVHRSAQFFCGDVLDQMEDEKEFLTSLIEEEFRGTLRKTRLLYRLDKGFPRNPHPLIDGVSPFVLLVRTASGQLVAGVSEGALVPQGNQMKRGWLVSLNRQRVWWAREDRQAVTHDNTFIIFGNQELRVAGNSTGVYSNFGAGNSFYRTNEGANDVTDFIGPTLPNNPREALLDTFEIFQLIFE